MIRSTPGGIVLLEDVAETERASEPQWTRVTADGRAAVLFQIYQQPGGNTVQIADGVKHKLRELRTQIPHGVTISNWYDQSQLITGLRSERPRCRSDRSGVGCAHAAGVSARLEGHRDRGAHSSCGPRSLAALALRVQHEPKHYDAGRDRCGCWTHHRRRDCNDRANRPAPSGTRGRDFRSDGAMHRRRVHAAASGFFHRDDCNLRAAGVSHWRDGQTWSASFSKLRTGTSSH